MKTGVKCNKIYVYKNMLKKNVNYKRNYGENVMALAHRHLLVRSVMVTTYIHTCRTHTNTHTHRYSLSRCIY